MYLNIMAYNRHFPLSVLIDFTVHAAHRETPLNKGRKRRETESNVVRELRVESS